MKAGERKDLAASVRQRLLNLAKARGEDFNFVLLRYGLERLLYRLSQSPHAHQFVLKGAMLFPLWMGNPHRATKDMDLLGTGSPDRSRLEAVFREVAGTAVADGLTFLPDTVKAVAIREDAIYDGVRVTLGGHLAAARLSLQVDVGFGDAVTPPPEEVEYPTLLPMPPARLRVYPREAVIAEKLHAMVDRGMATSRMKDFYDLWFLASRFEFDSVPLLAAIRATFAGRGTAIPGRMPLALTDTFADDAAKQVQWTAFIKRARLSTSPVGLQEVIEALRGFIGPLLVEADAITRRYRWRPETGTWSPPIGT